MTQVVHVRKFPFVQFTSNCVYLGRDYLEFKDEGWGNPFHIGTDGNRKTVLSKYRAWIITQPQLLARISELKGKVLGCWCEPLSCHGHVLKELADMRFTFDGGFKILLRWVDAEPRQWMIPGVVMVREMQNGQYQTVYQGETNVHRPH